MSFYAVANGKQTGIFDSWSACKLNTDGFKGAVFKKFDIKEDAQQFVDEYKKTKIENHSMTNKSTGNTKSLENIIEIGDSKFVADYYVYTDGSCLHNGRKDAIAGIGIYFGENDSRNVSQRVEGKQTNNTAELTAILYLYKIIENDIKIGKKIGVVSDSEYAIKCVSSYGSKCEADGWTKDIPNKDLVKQTYELYKNLSNVKFFHVMAHTDKSDIYSVGNNGSDKLANLAVDMDECPYNDKGVRVYLEVPFIKKDTVKGMGGHWDVAKKLWYINGNADNKDQVLTVFNQVL